MVVFLLLFPFLLHAIPTNDISAEVQWTNIYAGKPYTVTLSVTHDSNDKIDPSSFTADNKKITPTFDRTVKISVSSPLEISIYTLEMPGLPKGLQILPTYSVKIKDQVISSIPSGFEVQGEPTASGEGAFLKLEPVFTGAPPIYPGQRFFVGYRYLYNTSVDLVEEKLPLLEAKGFKRIGDKQIDSGEEKGVSITQVVQKVEAIEPGVYPFETSSIAGRAYTVDAKGNKQYSQTPLKSELNPFEIKVLPFPAVGKPASFRGAVGQYAFQAKLVGSAQVNVGDKIQLLLTVTGEGELEQLLPPDLCCQPGFSGYFKPSDLPPDTNIQGKTKTFLVDLYVENPDVTSIPPIEFSFFNPVSGKYEKKLSEAIPLTVTKVAPTPIPSEALPPVAIETSTFSPNKTTSISLPLVPLVVIGIGLLVVQATSR